VPESATLPSQLSPDVPPEASHDDALLELHVRTIDLFCTCVAALALSVTDGTGEFDDSGATGV
jgi:hypothetical protein